MIDSKKVTRPEKQTNDSSMIERQSIPTAARTEELIRERAFQKWENAGCPCSDGVEFWLQAETELAAENQRPPQK